MLTEAPISSPQFNLLPAGGNDPDRFDVKEAWYPIHYIEDLDPAKPTRFTLLEQDLVIWWDRQAGQWRAFVDQCPHRLVPLSEGRIAEDGLLECPYHGWAFRGDGACDRIPQQTVDVSAHTSKRACVTALPTVVQQGLLFVYPGQPENATQVKVPIIEPMTESPEEWICLNTFRDLPYDALTLLENVLDPSHVPFTHHKSVGNRSNAAPVELDVVEFGKAGFHGVWEEGPRKGTLGRQETQFIAPNLMWHDLTSKQFGRTLTVVYATPIRKGECRVFARFPFKFASKLPGFFIKLTPRWYSHIGQNNILEDDQIFLHYQERYLAAHGGSSNFAKAFYLPTRADAFVSALRKWVNEYEAEPFPGAALPPRLSPEVLLDRYHSHTQHCSSCRTALKRIQQIRFGVAIGGAIAWAMLPLLLWAVGQPSLLLAVFASVIPLLAGGVWVWLGQLEHQLNQGREIPPRNLPDKKS
ncbi:Rieske 2Fe-2S domain-containing protein [Pantanalinema sp. GBBB05]|uniref:aromatic ring-hydroxylating dioxygenase subunit alpha n=1 Tax=Pantanalinema sp. GBBB05 TaxID=2604139 RepID=UPI001D6F617E|nr:Rieske 2Fe-2S domain-containing protein [Pantanalinema sp. GBBB05]